MTRPQFDHLFRSDIRSIRNGVVIEHARERRRLEDGIQVGLSFTPVAPVNLGRQHHQAVYAGAVCFLRQPDRFRSTESSDAGDYRRLVAQGPPGLFKNLNLFFSGQRRRFAQRSKSDNSLAAALYHPSSLGSEGFVVD